MEDRQQTGENPEKRGEDAGGRLWGNYGQVRTISFRKQFVPIPEHSMQTTPRDWVPRTRDQGPETKDQGPRWRSSSGMNEQMC